VPDIRIVQNTLFPDFPPKYAVVCDWSLLADGSLDETEALATSVVVALGTDALAATSDILPDPDSSDRAGWWGNLDAAEIWDGWDIGSLLWLHKRDKIAGPEAMEGGTVQRVENHIRAAIQPFMERRIGSSFEVFVERAAREQINALIRIYRGPIREVDLRFQLLWDGIERTNPGYNVGRLESKLSAPFPTP
jgi:phage gp46-like protein